MDRQNPPPKGGVSRFFLAACLPALTVLIFTEAHAADRWVVQVATGSAYSFSTPLAIDQEGEERIELDADYDTKAWSTQAVYYDLRIGWWSGGKALEFETLHHKLHLSNNPEEVERFVISHGYNLNTLNYVWTGDTFDLLYRFGVGVVVTHPETQVRGKEYDDEGGLNGFHLSGVTAQLGVEKRFSLTRNILLHFEAKFTASHARIPVADGEASVPNLAVHGLFGIGYSWDR